MKLLFLECNMGIAGDMFLSALLDLFEEKEQKVDELNRIGIPGVKYKLEQTEKCGITGSHVRVIVDDSEEASADVSLNVNDHVHSHGCHEHEHEHHGHEHSHHEHEHEHHEHGHTHNHHGHAHGHGCHTHDHEHGHVHHHAGLSEITDLIESLQVSEKVKKDALAVYQMIAEAESAVHGKEVTQIHFHEVGTKDAVADVVGSAYLMEQLLADQVIFSPIATGYGMVKCAHGVLPVPAPATALILREIPSYSGKVQGELCTPTGAALAKYFAKEFGQRPVMKISRIGYGMGTKDFGFANCVRAFLGELA